MRISVRQALLGLLPPLLAQALGRAWRWTRDQLARRRIRHHDKLHLACGRNLLDGWINADLEGPRSVVKLDLTRALPVPTESIDYIYSEHFIEHIEREAAVRLLRECHRVLVPGGVLRVSTPSLTRLVAEYQAGNTDGWAEMDWRPATPAQMLNEGMRSWGHRFLFDAHELEMVLSEAGFRRVQAQAWRHSTHAPLVGLECRAYKGELIYDCVK